MERRREQPRERFCKKIARFCKNIVEDICFELKHPRPELYFYMGDGIMLNPNYQTDYARWFQAREERRGNRLEPQDPAGKLRRYR
jgi:hypothetical protein